MLARGGDRVVQVVKKHVFIWVGVLGRSTRLLVVFAVACQLGGWF